MLTLLRIKNVALIDEMEIAFGKGLNVLSGETGAGKSIIIDSIAFVFGERAGREFIRSGQQLARVDALIVLSSEETLQNLAELGVEPDEDGSLLVSRQITPDGKSSARINGRPVTTGILKEIASSIIDIHSQHQHQSLMDARRHMRLLDRFCGGRLPSLLVRLGDAFKDYKDAQKAKMKISQNPEELAAHIELRKSQINDIAAEHLEPGEETELMERRRILGDAEKLNETARRILRLLYDGDGCALDKLSSAQSLLEDISGYDSDLEDLAERLSNAYAEALEATREFRDFADGICGDEDELDNVEERLDVIYRLKKKYGKSVEDVMAFCRKAEEELETLLNSECELERLEALVKQHETLALELCGLVSKERGTAAGRIKLEVESILKDLGMKDAQFEISISRRSDFGAEGYDRVEFLISPNPGEPVMPLAKIASGGEMSRVMLALKAALADFDCMETFIFDEIDAGVSGRAAQMVAEKLSKIGKNHQILCITHLPQIAAMGDKNFLIEKETAGGETRTRVRKLDENGVIKELARLTGGAKITQVTLKAAEEMRRLAGGVRDRV